MSICVSIYLRGWVCVNSCKTLNSAPLMQQLFYGRASWVWAR